MRAHADSLRFRWQTAQAGECISAPEKAMQPNVKLCDQENSCLKHLCVASKSGAGPISPGGLIPDGCCDVMEPTAHFQGGSPALRAVPLNRITQEAVIAPEHRQLITCLKPRTGYFRPCSSAITTWTRKSRTWRRALCRPRLPASKS